MKFTLTTGPPAIMESDQNISVSAFYQGQCRHPDYGRIDHILQKLETQPNLLQRQELVAWLFPVTTVTANTNAPAVTQHDLQQFQQHYELRRQFNQAIRVTLKHFGMKIRANATQASDDFAQLISQWITQGDSAQITDLTQILCSMTLLGEKHLAETLLAILSRTQHAFPQYLHKTQLKHWQDAIAEGEAQCCQAFTPATPSYTQFWQPSVADKAAIMETLVFNNAEHAQIFLQLLTNKGFHSTKINDDIETLIPYPKEGQTLIHLTPGQLAICHNTLFNWPTSDDTIIGKDLIETLLK